MKQDSDRSSESQEFLRKVDTALRKTYRDVAEERRRSSKPLIVSRNGAVTLLPPEQMKVLKEEGALYSSISKPVTMESLRRRREDILSRAATRGAANVRVFGSVVRGEAGTGSDVDFLVDLEPGRSLLDLGGLLMDLQDILGCSVNIVTKAGLPERIRSRVLEEAEPL